MMSKIICVGILILVANYFDKGYGKIYSDAELKVLQSKILSHYREYFKSLEISAMAKYKAEKTFSTRKPHHVNCDATVPKIKTECHMRAQNIPIQGRGRGLYYISSDSKLSWRDADKWCRTRGLVLTSIETGYKETEIAELINSTIPVDEKITSFWTSGNNFGSSNQEYKWQSSNKTFTTSPKNVNAINRCVQITHDRTSQKLILEGANCRLTRGFVCDVPRHCYATLCYGATGIKRVKNKQPTPDTCPPEAKCAVNNNLFDTSGNIKESEAAGYVIKACGKKLFLGKEWVNIAEAQKKCCNLGMSLLTMESQQKLDCFMEQIFKASPSYETFLWLDTYTSSCTSSQIPPYVWCKAKKRFSTLGVPWLPSEPFCKSGMETGAILYINPRVSGLYAMTADVTTYIALATCEVDLPTTELNTTSSPEEMARVLIETGFGKTKTRVKKEYNANTLEVLSKIPACDKLKNCVTLKKKITDPKILNSEIETKVEACGKVYATSKKRFFYAKGWEFCCSIGMVLASFDSREQLDCAVDGIREDNKTFRSYLVASYGQIMENMNQTLFAWCKRNSTGNDFIKEELWCPGEPSNYKEQEPMVQLNVLSGFSCFADINIILGIPVLCEDPSKPFISPSTEYRRLFTLRTTTARPAVKCPTQQITISYNSTSLQETNQNSAFLQEPNSTYLQNINQTSSNSQGTNQNLSYPYQATNQNSYNFQGTNQNLTYVQATNQSALSMPGANQSSLSMPEANRSLNFMQGTNNSQSSNASTQYKAST